jgi:hypothetical protein
MSERDPAPSEAAPKNHTWADLARLTFSPDGRDTCASISDAELARAIAATGNLLHAAEMLSKAHGHLVARACIANRVDASPDLQDLYEAARAAHMQRAASNCIKRIAERQQERKRVVQEWRRLHDERVHLCDLRRARNEGPRCGAKTRTGESCKRKPELGKRRCRNHGGCSTGARTPEGRARALAALERGRRTQRLRRSAEP